MNNNLLKRSGVALAAIVLLGAGYVFGSNSGISGLTSLAGTLLPFWNQGPTVTISPNDNTPRGTLTSGRSQALAVFDVKSTSFTKGILTRLHLKVEKKGEALLNIKDVSVIYHYCDLGDSVGKYGYARTNCQQSSLNVVSAKPVADGYDIVINPNWVVYSSGISAHITVMGVPSYTDKSTNKVAEIRVNAINDSAVSAKECREIRYGYKGRYGYSKCQTSNPKINISGSLPWLKLARPYGYPTVPPKPPVVVGKCGLTVTSLSPNDKVGFPLTITGNIDNSNFKQLGCSWGSYKGVGGSAQLYFNYNNEGWKILGKTSMISAPNWTSIKSSFSTTLNFNNSGIGLPSGTPLKIVFSDDNATGLPPDTFELPIILK